MPAGEAPSGARAIPQGPFGTSIVGPYAGKDPLAFGTGNTFRVGEGQEVRLVDAGGKVIFSGSGIEGANRAVAVAQSISDELGKNANFKIQTGERTINPDGSVGGTRYIDVARAAPQQSGLGFLADAVLPFAASFIPVIGPIAGAALGSAASSAAQGRSLEDTLLRAAITAGATGLMPGGTPAPGSDAAINRTVNAAVQNAINAGAQAGASALGSVSGSALGSVAGGATGGLIDDIIVTALQNTTPSVVGSLLGATAGGTLPSLTSQPTQVQQTVDQEYTPPPEDLIVTAQQPNVTGIFPAVTGGISNTLLDQIVNQTPPAPPATPPAEPTVTPDEIVVTAQTGTSVLPPFVPPITVPPRLLPPSTTPTTPTDKTPPSKKDNVLGTGLSLTELLTLGGLGVSGLSTLFGGGGGGAGTTGVPYVSPFGTTGGFGTGMDYRAQPSIADYERYGFGPEAAFFRPEYSRLVSGAAGAPAATTMGPQGAMVNPVYQPLIGTGNVAAYTPNAPGSNPNAMKPGDIMTKGLESIFSQYGSQNQPMVAPGGSWDFYNRQRQQDQMFEAANPGLVLRDGMTSDEFEKYMQARDAFDRSATQTNAGSSLLPAGAETVVRGLLG
jgi:hypothetical protein